MLSSLPTDVLSQIISLLSVRKLGRLWLCGDTLLNWKLSEGGGVKELKFPHTFRVWPKLLVSSFPKLRSIEQLFSSVDLATLDITSTILWPQSIESLTLHFPGAIGLFTEALAQNPSHFRNLVHLKCSARRYLALNSATEDKPKRILASWIPPRLETFSLMVTTVCVSNYLDLDGDLPSSLKTLRPLIMSDTGVPRIPRTLTDLYLSIKSNINNWQSMIPVGLTSLEVYCSEKTPPIDWAALPRNLLRLEISTSTGYALNWVSHLPPHLTYLKLRVSYFLKPEDAALMPRSLTFANFSFPCDSDAQLFKALPRSLQAVQHLINVDLVPHLPPELRTMTLKIENSALKSFLPPRLHTLFVSDITSESVQYFPRTLTYIDINKGTLSPSAMAQLPPFLRYFTAGGDVVLDSADCFRLAPQSITSYTIRNIDGVLALGTESSKWFSRNLLFLEIFSCNVGLGWFNGLPASLKTIDLGLPTLSEEEMENLAKACPSLKVVLFKVSSEQNSIATLLKHMPRCCESFGIELESEEKEDPILCNEHLIGLPPKIKSLVLPYSSKVTKECKIHLPKQLDEFILGSSDPEWMSKTSSY